MQRLKLLATSATIFMLPLAFASAQLADGGGSGGLLEGLLLTIKVFSNTHTFHPRYRFPSICLGNVPVLYCWWSQRRVKRKGKEPNDLCYPWIPTDYCLLGNYKLTCTEFRTSV